MKTDKTTTRSVAAIAACFFVVAGCSSSDDGTVQTTDDQTTDSTVTISGVITNAEGNAPVPDVSVEAVYTTPGDAANPSTTTSDTGAFSLEVLIQDFFLHGTKAGFATMNSEKDTAPVDVTGLDIGMPTETEAQAIIDLAFATELPQLGTHAWLVVDVEDENGDEVGGENVTITSSVPTADAAYTECDGTDGGSTTTVACEDRVGAMFIAYFDAAGEASISVDGVTKTAPIRFGEVTFLDYELGGNELPIAANDAFNVVQGAMTILNVSANDSDADDGLDLTSITIVAAPVSGTASPNPDGTITYVHNGAAIISDSFSYAISDNSGEVSNTAVVSLTVFGTVAAGQSKYVDDCASCHRAGTFDTEGSASDLAGDGEKLVTNLSSIPGMTNIPNIDISVQELIDLKAFLESL